MAEINRVSIWMQQIRAPFLLLAVMLVLIGIATAGYQGSFHLFHSVLLMVGVVLTHASVNLFNELSDYQTGIDRHTTRTPFSGGSGMMQSGKTTPRAVTVAATATLMVAAGIGIYFWSLRGWLILIFMVFGAVAIRFYTPVLSRWLLGELFSGLTLGSFVVMGTHYALTGRLGIEIILISIPPGILTSLLLFLNEFPDAEADRMGGRYHLVIHLGRKKSAALYIFGLVVVYGIIAWAGLMEKVPDTVFIAMLTLPLAAAAVSRVVRYHDDPAKLVPAMGLNVAVVILTDLFLAVGYFLA